MQSRKGGVGPQSIFTSFLPGDTTYDSIRIIINTQDERERDELTAQWRTHKLEELNFIGIVVRCAFFLKPSFKHSVSLFVSLATDIV